MKKTLACVHRTHLYWVLGAAWLVACGGDVVVDPAAPALHLRRGS